MGVDLNAITGHKLSSSEVLELPSRLNNHKGLMEASKKVMLAFADLQIAGTNRDFIWNWGWEYGNSIEYIEELWKEEEETEFCGMPHNLTGSFGIMHINRNTIDISFFIKYWTFGEQGRIIQDLYIDLGKEIAMFFEQDRIIFYPDSMHPQQGISQYVMSIDEIEKFANATYGPPNENKQKAIESYYYIERI